MFGSDQVFFSGTTGFYPKTIGQSLRFNSALNDHLDKTLGTPDDQKLWTVSLWVKRATLGTSQMLLSAGTSSVSYIQFQADDTLKIRGSGNLEYVTTRKFRDIGSWYHFVFILDSVESTDTERARLYLNGDRITDFSTYAKASLNEVTILNSAVKHSIGNYSFDSGFDFDGYIAEMYFTDGYSYEPSEFGETKNDIWIPKAPSVTFGNNGFHLEFANSSDIGNDISGRNNDFSVNNLTASDVVSDSPTDNHATLGAQPIVTHTLSEGRLKSTNSSGTHGGTTATINYPTSGKWYHEVTINAEDSSGGNGVGIGNQIGRTATNWGNYLNLVAYLSNGRCCF